MHTYIVFGYFPQHHLFSVKKDDINQALDAYRMYRALNRDELYPHIEVNLQDEHYLIARYNPEWQGKSDEEVYSLCLEEQDRLRFNMLVPIWHMY